MKIGVDIRCLMGGRYSGVPWYAYNLLSAMFRLDKQNEYVLYYNSSSPAKLPEFAGDNVRIIGTAWPNKLFNLALFAAKLPYLDKLMGGCDVFFAPNLNFLSFSADCRKVLAVHDLSFLIYPEFFTLRQRLWHKLVLERAIRQADVIIANSEATKRDFVDLLRLPPEKIRVVHLGIDRKFPTAEAVREVSRKYDLPEKFFLFVGTSEPRKNLSAVAEALTRLDRGVKLIVAGGEYRRGCESWPGVRFLGYVDEADKPALYRAALALIYPSYYEGFGLPLLEAMVYGCPAIGGNNSSQGEVLGDAGLLVNPYNVTEISRALAAMLDDEPLRQRLIENGLSRASDFSWDKAAQETLKIFEELKQP